MVLLGLILALFWLERGYFGYKGLVFLRKHWSHDGNVFVFFRFYSFSLKYKESREYRAFPSAFYKGIKAYFCF